MVLSVQAPRQTYLEAAIRECVKTREALSSTPLPAESAGLLRRLLQNHEHSLRLLEEEPFDVVDPIGSPAFQALGEGHYRRRRLPTMDDQEL